MLKIITSSPNTTSETTMKLVFPANPIKFKDCIGASIDITDYVQFEENDTETGEIKSILSVMDSDGRIYASNSPSFQKDFFTTRDLCEQLNIEFKTIEIYSGTSKKGRTFIYCRRP